MICEVSRLGLCDGLPGRAGQGNHGSPDAKGRGFMTTPDAVQLVS